MDYEVSWCFLLILLSIHRSISFQCKGENNESVDWFIVYKFPKLYDSPNKKTQNGETYLYISNESLESGWALSEKSILSEHTAPGYTLAPYYKPLHVNETWLMYNDVWIWITKGHTKGVIGGDNRGGFWMVHSVPHYPTTKSKYSYPTTGLKYGQSFLCISLTTNDLDSLGPNVIDYNDPHFFKKIIDEKIFPKLNESVNGKKNSKANTTSLIKSIGGKVFTVFAKSRIFGKDLYYWVANELETDLLVQTWRNEIQPLPSTCDGNLEVLNIESITFLDMSFDTRQDHSKWAISKEEGSPWVCIGDINRTKHQRKRGGGTVCMKDKDLWKNFYNIVQSTEKCPKSN